MKNLTKVFPGGREILKGITLSFLPGAKIGGALERLLDREQTPEYDEPDDEVDGDDGDASGPQPRFVLCLPEDRAGIDVAEHASGDPLARLYREAVSDDARAMLEES